MKFISSLLLVLVTAASLLAQSTPPQAYSAPGVVVTPLLKTSVTIGGQPIVYPKTDSPEVTAVIVEIPADRQTGWHRHPVPCYAYVLSGAISVELEDGSIHEAQAGQAIVETLNLLHNGTNKGTEPVKILLFAMGSKGSAFSAAAQR